MFSRALFFFNELDIGAEDICPLNEKATFTEQLEVVASLTPLGRQGPPSVWKYSVVGAFGGGAALLVRCGRHVPVIRAARGKNFTEDAVVEGRPNMNDAMDGNCSAEAAFRSRCFLHPRCRPMVDTPQLPSLRP